MILHVHKERVDRLDLDKIYENYVSGRKDTLIKLGLNFVNGLRILSADNVA